MISIISILNQQSDWDFAVSRTFAANSATISRSESITVVSARKPAALWICEALGLPSLCHGPANHSSKDRVIADIMLKKESVVEYVGRSDLGGVGIPGLRGQPICARRSPSVRTIGHSASISPARAKYLGYV